MGIQLGHKCTCAAKQAAECYLRSHGVILADSNDDIVHADAEAVEVLRGPAEEWDGMRTQVLHDGTASGNVHQHWEYLEHIAIGGADKHHFLVVKRESDHAVCWVQTCIHELAAKDGRQLRLWHVRDVTGAARCLEMSQSMADGEYTLSLEDDGLPHSSLLTQVPGACSYDLDVRNQLADMLGKVVASEQFAVVQLTGFGAIDTVFPRRMLGWDEGDLLDRSFIGLLCAEDRGFFCQALRRCQRDGIPQRLALKLRNAANAHIDCDVTVLMPELVQQPVLVVCATDQAPLASAAQGDTLGAQQDSVHTVGREIFASWPYAQHAEAQVLSSPSEASSSAASSVDDRAMQPAPLSISMCSPPHIGADALQSASLNTLASPASPREGRFDSLWDEEKHSGNAPGATQLLFDRLADADAACDKAAGRCTAATDASILSPTLPVRRSDTVSTAVALPGYSDVGIGVDIPMCEIFSTAKPHLAGNALSYSTEACEQYSPPSNPLVSALLGTSSSFGAATQSPQQKSC
ncbi:hypothetical protein EV183_004636 [Coemansia sp. RSA 2336]|nr:hypothetical protein EV183_004636 [Coemansia sp. RSA 2336]